MNNPKLQQPTVKRLAQHSLVAERCITASTQCVPASASWLTGLWPCELGVPRNTDYVLPASSPSFVRSLQEQAWKTALIGRTHWHPHTEGVDLRDQIKLLQKLGFYEAEETAGLRAPAEVNCALTDDWYTYEPGLRARSRDDTAERYHGGSPWRVKP